MEPADLKSSPKFVFINTHMNFCQNLVVEIIAEICLNPEGKFKVNSSKKVKQTFIFKHVLSLNLAKRVQISKLLKVVT
jgi:hypothetical protein